MNCNECSDKLDSYVHGELSAQECAEIEAHLRECDTFREEMELAKKIADTLKNLPPIEVPADFKMHLYEKIKHEKKIHFYMTWKPYAALAACIVLAVVLRTGVADMLNAMKAPAETPVPAMQTVQKTNAPTAVPQITEQPVHTAQDTEQANKEQRNMKSEQKNEGDFRRGGQPNSQTAALVPSQTVKPDTEIVSPTQIPTQVPAASAVPKQPQISNTAAPAPDIREREKDMAQNQPPVSESFGLRSALSPETADAGGGSSAAPVLFSAGLDLPLLRVESGSVQTVRELLEERGAVKENDAYTMTAVQLQELLHDLDEREIVYQASFDAGDSEETITFLVSE